MKNLVTELAELHDAILNGDDVKEKAHVLCQAQRMIKDFGSTYTRLDVVDHTEGGIGVLMHRKHLTVKTSVQDNGKTLKVFLSDNAEEVR